MRGHIINRLLQALPVIFSVIIINFFLIHLAPGDPAVMIAGEEATPEYLELIREKMGFNKPIYIQLLIYLRQVFSGDLGYSYYSKRPVLDVIAERMPNTIFLLGTAFIFSILIGVVLGVVASKRLYSLTDDVISFLSLTLYSLPSFWLGMIFILIFALHLRIFPTSGIMSVKVASNFLDRLWHLCLPASVITIYWLALYTRITRGSMLETMKKDYIMTAWSKGCSERTVFFKHALRNALLPIVTVIGLRFRVLFTGSVVIETVFAWPGIGRLMYDAIIELDYPVLMGGFIIVSLVVVLANLVTDIIYTILDPRIRYG